MWADPVTCTTGCAAFATNHADSMKPRPPITHEPRSSLQPKPKAQPPSARPTFSTNPADTSQPKLRLTREGSADPDTAEDVIARIDDVEQRLQCLAQDVDCLGRVDGRSHEDPPRPRAA